MTDSALRYGKNILRKIPSCIDDSKLWGKHLLGPELMFAKRDKHYPSRSGQTSLVATAVANITKPVTKNNFGPSRCMESRFIKGPSGENSDRKGDT